MKPCDKLCCAGKLQFLEIFLFPLLPFAQFCLVICYGSKVFLKRAFLSLKK